MHLLERLIENIKLFAQRRLSGLRQHLHEVVAWLGGDSTSEWTLESLIVVDQALFAPYLRHSPILVVTIE